MCSARLGGGASVGGAAEKTCGNSMTSSTQRRLLTQREPSPCCSRLMDPVPEILCSWPRAHVFLCTSEHWLRAPKSQVACPESSRPLKSGGPPHPPDRPDMLFAHRFLRDDPILNVASLVSTTGHTNCVPTQYTPKCVSVGLRRDTSVLQDTEVGLPDPRPRHPYSLS